MELKNIEFFGTPEGEIEIREYDKAPYTYTEKNIELTNAMWKRIENFYPDAASALRKEYSRYAGNRLNYVYRMVHRFIRCNFKEYDRTLDIDHNGLFYFEQVKCPLIGECLLWDIVCNPQFNCKLSSREMEIMELFYEGWKQEDIAEHLSISIRTVETHKSNAFRKVKVDSLANFVLYARKVNLFKNR